VNKEFVLVMLSINNNEGKILFSDALGDMDKIFLVLRICELRVKLHIFIFYWEEGTGNKILLAI
jgi:hypothetical protein